MARPIPADFGEMLRRVLTAVEAARGADRRHFDFSREVEPGVRLDLPQVSRSQSRPDVYYALLDHASPRRIHAVLRRLVPSLESHAA